MKCAGEPYHSSNVLKCNFDALAYEIECSEREGSRSNVEGFVKCAGEPYHLSNVFKM